MTHRMKNKNHKTRIRELKTQLLFPFPSTSMGIVSESFQKKKVTN